MPNLSAKDDAYFESLVNDIALQLYQQKITTGTIPQAMYEATADRIMRSVLSGMDGAAPYAYDNPNNSLLAYLRQNVHAFSAAKSLTMLRQFNDLLVGDDGKLRSQAQFIAACAATGAEFNKNYLATERITAIAKAQSAQAWDTYQDGDIIEILTAGDDRVRPAHAILDHFTAPKTDPVWQRLWPPFDWRCRCKTSHGLAKNIIPFKTADLLKEAQVPKYFQTNAGTQKTVFDKDHPYYTDTFSKDRELEAVSNYGMQSVAKIYQDNHKPARSLPSKAEAANWWTEKTGSKKGSFTTVDVLGNTLLFDASFYSSATKGDRYGYLSNIEDIVAAPDEVWSMRDGNTLITTYIRYYEDGPYAVRTDGVDAYELLRYQKDGEADTKSTEKDRRGILMYRKN